MPSKPKDNATNSGRVAFPAIIRNVSTRIDAAGDKIGRLVVEFRPEGDTVAELDKLHQPDAEVFMVVMDKAGE
jgi:hypothetical protein